MWQTHTFGKDWANKGNKHSSFAAQLLQAPNTLIHVFKRGDGAWLPKSTLP